MNSIRSEQFSDDWREQATCAGVDPEVFYLHTYYDEETEDAERQTRIDWAKELCGGCDVWLECLGGALREEAKEAGRVAKEDGVGVNTLQHRHGIRGGRTEEEREAIANRESDDPVEFILAGVAIHSS